MSGEELMRNKDPVSYGSPDPLPFPGQPGYPHLPALTPPQTTAFQAEESILYLSEAEAKEAFLQFATSKCCYGTAPAKHMLLRSMTALNTYRYTLQTFMESRSIQSASEPYDGGIVDSPAMGVPPGPWDVAVNPPPPFADCEIQLPVPHTSSVQTCPCCLGVGSTLCSSCGGTGTKVCFSCGGSGSTADANGIYSSCLQCGGSGQTGCMLCLRQGWVACVQCNREGLLLCHLELTITWKNTVAEYVADRVQGFPASRFQKVTGKHLLSEEQPLVTAVNLPQPLVQGANSCLARHQMQVSEETRILRQRHAVEIIPLTEISYEWKGKEYSFYVFGNEKKVYVKDYPGKCCCALL